MICWDGGIGDDEEVINVGDGFIEGWDGTIGALSVDAMWSVHTCTYQQTVLCLRGSVEYIYELNLFVFLYYLFSFFISAHYRLLNINLM